MRRRKDRAGDAAKRRTHCECQQFYVAGIDAHRLGGNLVLADRLPRAAKARILQAEIDYDDADGDQQQEVVVLLRSGKRHAENDLGPREGEAAEAKRIDQVDALRAVGDIERSIEVVKENADDLAETERYDGEIVAAELQRGCAEQHAKSAGDSRAQGENDPERKMNAEVRRRQQRIDVRADGVEGDVPEIEQARETDDDVESQREHDVEHCKVENANPGLAGERRDEGQQRQRQREQHDACPDLRRNRFRPRPVHARSATRSPSKPDGRNISTSISTKNANTSW